MTIKWVNELPIKGKRIFCRVDFNVPLDDACRVTDDTRIRAALPTIKEILAKGGMPICASHLGRPKKPDPKLRMEPVGARLAELLGPNHRVLVTDEPAGDGTKKVVADMQPGDVVLLENVRFNPGETKNDPAFAKELASMADGFINDAFGSSHRAHASVVGIAELVSFKGGGFLLKQEIEFLGRLLGNVQRPYAAILGGAKVSDKVGVLENLIHHVNVLLIGGAMANTFLKARGAEVGASRVEEDSIDTALKILDRAQRQNVEVLLPVDVVAASSLDASEGQVVSATDIPAGLMALDIGPETRKRFADRVKQSKTIFWNGPMGVFEKKPFAQGTMAIAEAVAKSGALSVVGGGDSVSAIQKSGFADKVSHISTGGGASLEFVQGLTLPGIAALEV